MADNKEEYESLWETLLDMGLRKAILLLWTIYLSVYVLAMAVVYWLTKR